MGRALGATDLKPEESEHLSLGLVWNPVSAFELSVDYYQVDIQDRIVLSGNFTGAQVAALLAPFNVTGARFFTNAIDTETKGCDITASYSFAGPALGTLRLWATWSPTRTSASSPIPATRRSA